MPKYLKFTLDVHTQVIQFKWIQIFGINSGKFLYAIVLHRTTYKQSNIGVYLQSQTVWLCQKIHQSSIVSKMVFVLLNTGFILIKESVFTNIYGELEISILSDFSGLVDFSSGSGGRRTSSNPIFSSAS